MNNHPYIYIGVAFTTGVLLTVSLRDTYPELKERLWKPGKKTSKDAIKTNKSHESTISPDSIPSARPGPPIIVDGIEGCIGNTPLLRIKSLSEATGCEVLAKAEVCALAIFPLNWELNLKC